ncbi:hypothetical protein BDF21DRAFT_395040 [Thamnidium elegans]|nr:hypothetical protein BDF21DRAFT_395040 [Thamnidium elegans]
MFLKKKNARLTSKSMALVLLLCLLLVEMAAKLFRRFRDLLIRHFTVVLYDRRGYFRSQFTGPQDHANRITTDVDDLYQLMTHTLQMKSLLSLVSVTEGKNESLEILDKKYLNLLDQDILINRQKHKRYPFSKLDWDMVNARKDKLVILYGIDSVGFLITELVADIARRLDKETFPFPGRHIGFYTHHKAFYNEFIELCKAHPLLSKSSPIFELSPFLDPLLLDQSKL